MSEESTFKKAVFLILSFLVTFEWINWEETWKNFEITRHLSAYIYLKDIRLKTKNLKDIYLDTTHLIWFYLIF